MNPSPSPTAPFDLFGWLAGAALGSLLISILVSAVLACLGMLATYWLIRLAVRHGTMDTARWQAGGTPGHGSHRAPVAPLSPAPNMAAAPSAQQPPPRRRPISDVPVPPRSTMDW